MQGCLTILYHLSPWKKGTIHTSHLSVNSFSEEPIFFFFFWLPHAACKILVPGPGTEPGLWQRKPNPNHWTTRNSLAFLLNWERFWGGGTGSLSETFLIASLQGHVTMPPVQFCSLSPGTYTWVESTHGKFLVRFKSSSQSRKLLTAAFPRLILQTNHKKETLDVDRCPCYVLTENPSVW